MRSTGDLPSLKVGTGWIGVEIVGEPDVVLGFKGYAPVLPVKVMKTNLEYVLYISAKSLATPLEALRRAHGDTFMGLRVQLRKESADQFAKYEVRSEDSHAT